MDTASVHRRVRGFTAIEMIVVILLIGIMSAVAMPYIRNATLKSNVTGAINAVASLHSLARAVAIQRGRTAVLVLDGSTAFAVVVLKRTGSAVVDTVGRPENLGSRFGVTLSTTQDSVIFTPRGIGTGAANVTVIAARSGYADTLTISPAGRLVQ